MIIVDEYGDLPETPQDADDVLLGKLTSMDFEPRGNLVSVRRLGKFSPDDNTVGGLHLPECVNKFDIAEVLRAGRGMGDGSGGPTDTSDLKTGMRVLIKTEVADVRQGIRQTRSFRFRTSGGDEMELLNQSDILAIVDPMPKEETE